MSSTIKFLCEGDRFGGDWVTNIARRMVSDAEENETIEQTFERKVLNNG